jgi:DNA-binding transcriptional LysR family regulator
MWIWPNENNQRLSIKAGMDQFKAVATFVRAATLGSFGKAAVEMGITQQQASKSIKQLETHLGVRLFNRSTRRVSLTDDGQRFFADASAGLARLEQAFENARLGHDDAAGSVRLTAPQAMARSLLVPLLLAFRQAHPRIVVELLVDDHMTDLVAQRIDVGIRAGTIQDGRLVARKLVPIQHIVCAAPAFLASRGVPRTIDDLPAFDCTAFRHVNTGKVMPWEFMQEGRLSYRDVAGAFLTNDVEAECEAVVRGLAIGQLASFAAVPHIRAHRLVPLFLEAMTERFAMYLYYPSREHLPTRVRLLVDFLTTELRDNDDLFLGAESIARLAGTATRSAASGGRRGLDRRPRP